MKEKTILALKYTGIIHKYYLPINNRCTLSLSLYIYIYIYIYICFFSDCLSTLCLMVHTILVLSNVTATISAVVYKTSLSFKAFLAFVYNFNSLQFVFII